MAASGAATVAALSEEFSGEYDESVLVVEIDAFDQEICHEKYIG